MPVTKYIWDNENYLAEADAANTINVVYTNEPQQYGKLVSTRTLGTSGYHAFDAIGSTRQLTSSAAAVTDTAIYDAWGTVVLRTGTTQIAMLWVGELEYYFDTAVGLSSVRRRPYSSPGARWMTIDPAGAGGQSNLFNYVSNSPMNASDPSGLLPGYGNWCGPRSGPGLPIDSLDTACRVHDDCLASPLHFLIPLRRRCCDAVLCLAALRAYSSDCDTDYGFSLPPGVYVPWLPTVPKAWAECKKWAITTAALMCGPGTIPSAPFPF
jgi:RHS repeat-associated protein